MLEFDENGEPILNNTGVLFFTDESMKKHIPQNTIQCALFKGITKVHILDKLEVNSDLLTNIDEAIGFVKKSIRVGYDISELQRKEVWEIPLPALREAIVNAVAHRDYTHKGTFVQVEVYDDRVEINNYGPLFRGLTKADLGKKSARRNPNIVDLLHRADYIERMGTGILRIQDELNKVGLPPAEFDITSFFTIIIKRQEIEEMDGVVEKDSLDKTETILKEFQEKITATSSKKQRNMFLLLDAIRKDSQLSLNDFSERHGIALRTLQLYISGLKEDGFITTEGKTSSVKYILTDKSHLLFSK